ncbi:phosphoadenosine phosphosulfate reductase family protein [Stenotrophomonas indicatrix]|uniref:phosphoadenosine phosphosulfate reductase domain-containing protein n=1 Tax=Stenotrophomonas indicatrix TaxID=2045451 RepID=UPI0028B1F96A|nr:phosphoadenosine phosphosulfate reductase family protein [Stenotrophomonas indicatrix]
MNPYLLPEGNVQIAFSGGRSSGYMLHQILEANGSIPKRAIVTFQNTGREMPETLDFVHEVGNRWGVQIEWLEYLPDSPGFIVVDHASAARTGEPFEALIRKRKFLPNVRARFCTTELKIRAAKRFLMAQGWKKWTNCTGLRADEQRRLNKPKPKERWTTWNPMADAGIVKQDVSKFWSTQPFDLQLLNDNGKTPYGNCDGCFLKSESIVARLAVDHPERAAWWEEMEELASGLTSGAGGKFSKRYSRKELRIFLQDQGQLVLETDGLLCQADEGECFG